MQWEDDVAEADADTLASTPCALRADVCGGSAEGVLVLYSLSKQSEHGRVSYGAYRWRSIADRADGGIPQTDRQIIPGPVQAAMAAGLRDFDAVKTQHARYQERLGMLVSALRAYGILHRHAARRVVRVGESQVRRLLGGSAPACRNRHRRQPRRVLRSAGILAILATASDAAIASAAERLAR